MDQKIKRNESANRNGSDFVHIPMILQNFKVNSHSDLSVIPKSLAQIESKVITDFFGSNDLDFNSLLSTDEVSFNEETFMTIDTNEDEYISKDELSQYIFSLKESLKVEDISLTEFEESMENLGLIQHEATQEFEKINVSTTENGNEVIIEGNYTNLENAILVTLDDTTSTDDEIIINFMQEDGVDQIVDYILVDGIEDVTLNILTDNDNSSDDVVSINQLVLDDTETLSIVSEESIVINHIKSDSLETIDLTQANAGFEIYNVESSNIITFKVDTLKDDTGRINYDSDDNGILDSSFSIISLNKGITEIIEFQSTSFDGNLLINNIELGTSENSDMIDFSSLGVISMDELVFTDDGFNSVEMTSDSFDGSIILVGISSDQVDSANFILQ